MNKKELKAFQVDHLDTKYFKINHLYFSSSSSSVGSSNVRVSGFRCRQSIVLRFYRLRHYKNTYQKNLHWKIYRHDCRAVTRIFSGREWGALEVATKCFRSLGDYFAHTTSESHPEKLVLLCNRQSHESNLTSKNNPPRSIYHFEILSYKKSLLAQNYFLFFPYSSSSIRIITFI